MFRPLETLTHLRLNDPTGEVTEALRRLQQLDEVERIEHRHLLIAALTALGAALGLECTGTVDGWNEDGSPAYYSHDGDTCPIHEWLVPEDAKEVS